MKIYYFCVIDDHKDKIIMGFKMIEEATRFNGENCITFKKRTNEVNFIRVVNGNGCSSKVSFSCCCCKYKIFVVFI